MTATLSGPALAEAVTVLTNMTMAAMNGEGEITRSHRQRLAAVYLRQSSMAQVREHTESMTRQYGLVDEAVRLGSARSDVVIGTDLGVGPVGRGPRGVHRAGEQSVLRGDRGDLRDRDLPAGRSNAKVARLMEFAAITETLLIDAVNDRMLLGMKSMIGAVELHVMAQRLQASKKATAERGELRTPLPVGYVHDELGDLVIDPDDEVQAAVRDLFAAFTVSGSAYGLVAVFADRRFPLRLRRGLGRPAALAPPHQRSRRGGAEEPVLCRGLRARPVRLPPHRRAVGTVHTGLVERPRAEWPMLIPDHHEGYLTWGDYLGNEAKLAANRTTAGARPPREGSTLRQGVIICGADCIEIHYGFQRMNPLFGPCCGAMVTSGPEGYSALQVMARHDPIGLLVKRAREQCGMSQYTLAKLVVALSDNGALSRTEVARWERGRRIPGPYWRHLLKRCARLAVRPAWYCGTVGSSASPCGSSQTPTRSRT